MASEKEKKAELLALTERQKEALLAQLKKLAELLPESEEAKQAKADLRALEKAQEELAEVEVSERWKPASLTAARRQLAELCRHFGLDKLFSEEPLCIVGILTEYIEVARYVINKKTENTKKQYKSYVYEGKKILENIEKEKKEYINNNKLKTELNKEWDLKGLSELSENQWSRSISLWAASKEYKDVENEFFKYIPSEQLNNPYVFRNILKANIIQKDKILKYIPKNYTEGQRKLIKIVIDEAEMLFDIISLDDDSKKITLNVKEKDDNTIFITPYQAGRIKREIGDKFKIFNRYGKEFKLKIKKA